MRIIKIDTEAYLYENEYKGYVYSEEFFDDVFVITGNNDYKGTSSASWYKKAVEYLEEKENETGIDEVMKALEVLFPDDKFDWFTITGSVQGEWQYVICKTNEFDNYNRREIKDVLSDFYFGYVAEIIDDEECTHDYISKTELWELEDAGNLKEFVRDLMCIDEDFKLIKSDGYVSVKNWVTVD